MILLLILFVFFSTINLETLFGKTFFVGGVPLLTWIVYALYIILLIYYAYDMFSRRKADLLMLVWYVFLLISLVISLFSNITWRSVLSNSVFYALPILLYRPIINLKKKQVNVIEQTIRASVIIYGLLALAFMVGALGKIATNDISTLSRSSTIVDGGLGLVGVALGIHGILYQNTSSSNALDKKKVYLNYILLIAGTIIVISGMSRARIITAGITLVLSLLFSYNGKTSGKRKRWKIVAFLALGILICLYVFPLSTGNLKEVITERFAIIGTDNSSIYREYERLVQIKYFLSNPLTGTGWGGMADVLVRDTRGVLQEINNHNMYTSILANGGLLFAIPFFLWFIRLGIYEFRAMKTDRNACVNFVLLIVIAILSWSSAGFVKYSMTIAMMIIYLNIRNRGEIRNEEDRNINLS